MLRTGLAWLVVVGGLFGAAGVPIVRADEVLTNGSAAMSASQREAMYASLSREVEELERRANVLKMVVKLVSPTVVHLEARKVESSSRPYAGARQVEESGSGVLIDVGGNTYVLTNRHVIKNARLEDIVIKLAEGRELVPQRTWEDKDTDIAVMAVDGQGLIPARLGDSDVVEVGDFVLAVGSPFGLSHSVSYGIISAKGRRDLDLGEGGVRFQDFMQTDAAINPGNSGGPLLNLRGEVIGINTAIASNHGGNEGIGFSIPINMAMVVVRQLVEQGKVQRAFLGVTLNSKFTTASAMALGLPVRQGAHITAVTPNSPAQAVGLQPDDVILMFNGQRIETDSHLVNLISLTPVGSEVPLVVWRNRATLDMKVRVGDMNSFKR